MRRLRLYDFRLSRGPTDLGICQGDVNRCAQVLNAAQERLLYDKAQGDEGWNGTFAEMVFSVDRRNPYITCPRGVARLESIDVCGRPVPLYNQFYDFLQFGNGRMGKEQRWRNGRGFLTSGHTRNNAVTFTDISDGPQQILIYCTNPGDVGKRVLVQGNVNGSTLYTQDGSNTVMGEFVTLAMPFSTSINAFDNLTGIQKDVTLNDIQIFQTDPVWGSQEILLVMEPSETTASYRRYYLQNLPLNCCQFNRYGNPKYSPDNCGCPSRRKEWVLVTAIVKLDLIPVVSDTDYCVIQNLEALIEECKSIRYSNMDSSSALQNSLAHHQKSIQLLVGESSHFNGKNQPAIIFRPFGSANLNRIRIGMR